MLPVSIFRLLAVLLISNMAALAFPPNVDRHRSHRRHQGRFPSAETRRLSDHSGEFNRSEIVSVTNQVHVAIGYALSNMIIVNGSEGLVIVDTTENSKIATRIISEFRRTRSNLQPIRGIILTHSHKDHISGVNEILKQEAKGEHIPVYAHCTLTSTLARYQLKLRAVWRRTSKQLGVRLSDSDHINSGIGPRLRVNNQFDRDPTPTHTFCDSTNFTLAGTRFELYHTPGESGDQLTVWLPDERVAMPGDNIYKAFPNMYSIKGESARDPIKWADSLDFLLSLRPEHLVPSHTRPLSGASEVASVVMSYRDAIRFVHDQTLRHVNRGTRLDEIVSRVKLPDCLSAHPYLQEFYGSVEWSVRGVYQFYMGWFDGEPSSMFPLSGQDEADLTVRMIERSASQGTASGLDLMLMEAERGLEEDFNGEDETLLELRWSLKLAETVALRVCDRDGDSYDATRCERSRRVRVGAMRQLAARCVNSNARNYLLSSANELGATEWPTSRADSRSTRLYIDQTDLDYLMSQLPAVYDPCGSTSECRCGETIVGRLEFDSDSSEARAYELTARNCVLSVRPLHRRHGNRVILDDAAATAKVDFVLQTSSVRWRQMLKDTWRFIILFFQVSGERGSFLKIMTTLNTS